MKKRLIIVSVWLMIFTGCDKKEIMPEPSGEGTIPVSLSAAQGSATKTSIGGEDGYTVTWDLNDKLGVFVNTGTGNVNLPFTLNPLDADKTSGQFFGKLNAFNKGTLYAYYPYDETVTTSSSVPVSVIDEKGNQYFDGKAAGEQEVSGDFGDFGRYSYMVADPVSDLNLSANAEVVVAPVLAFRHVTSVLDFVLTASADMTVSSIALNTGGRNAFVTGGTLDITSGNEARTVNNPVKSDELTLVLGTSAAASPLVLNANEPKTLRMVVFPVNLTDIPVTITVSGTVNGKNVALSIVKSGKKLERGLCYNTPVNISVVADVSSAGDAFGNGSSAVVITEPVTSSAAIALPAVDNRPDQSSLSLAAPIGNGATLTIDAPSVGTAPEKVSVNNTSSSDANACGNVSLNLPASTVNMLGNYNEVTASTAENTLIVEENCTIARLNVNKGNVKVYGNVTEQGTVQPGCTITYYVKDADELLKKIQENNEAGSGATLSLIGGKGYDLSTAASDIVITKPLVILSDHSDSPAHLLLGETVFVCQPDVETVVCFRNLELEAGSPKGTGAINAYGNTLLTVDHCKITQKRKGGSDSTYDMGLGINIKGDKNVLSVTGTTIYLPETYQIGVNADGLANVQSGRFSQVVFNTSKITTNDASMPKTYSRGINIMNMNCDARIKVLSLDGSAIEGMYYPVNITGTAYPLTDARVEVKNSTLDGRCGLNVKMKVAELDIDNCTITGHNYYTGQTEEFGNIVLEKSGNVITVANSTFKINRNPVTGFNRQFVISFNESGGNVISFTGNNQIVDNSGSMDFFINDDPSLHNDISGIQTICIVSTRSGASVLPGITVWDGVSVTEPDYSGDNYKIYAAAELAWLADQINKGKTFEKKTIFLCGDIDWNHKPWSVDKRISNLTFDGQGYCISNLNIIQTQAAGLFGDVVTATIKNLTLKNASVKSEQTNGDQNAYAGGFIGRCYGSTIIENCTLENSVVEGINKVGGMVGFNAENALTITDCTVKGSTIKTDDTQLEHGQCGGVVGYVGNVYKGTTSVSGTYVIDTKVEATSNVTQNYRHTNIYVGSFQGSDGDRLTITAPVDAVQNSTLNGVVPGTTVYNGLLGGVRYKTTLSGSTILTINGTRYTE